MRRLGAIAAKSSWAWGGVLVVLLLRCDAHMLIGADAPDGSDPSATDDGGGAIDAGATPLTVPWSTGFESGFTDWYQPPGQGYCYLLGGATFNIVTSPVHTGTHAAAFMVNSANFNSETRCLRQGILPAAAYYGAWYYVPAPAVNTQNWNLLHFRGGSSLNNVLTHGLWDVSLVNEPDGALDPSVFDFLRMHPVEAGPAIPIGQWFHLEVFLRRSDAGAGEFTLYVDGNPVVHLTDLTTDDSALGSWHVGNLATALAPPVSTVYVDDVSIDTSGP